MFPAVVSSKLKAAIGREEESRRLRVQAEQGMGKVVGGREETRASEFEMLLNEYSKIEADTIKVCCCCCCC